LLNTSLAPLLKYHEAISFSYSNRPSPELILKYNSNTRPDWQTHQQKSSRNVRNQWRNKLAAEVVLELGSTGLSIYKTS